MSDSDPEISLSHEAEIADVEPNMNDLIDDTTIDPKDIQALTLAISGIAEAIVRKVVTASLSSVVPPLVLQSVQAILPETLPPLVMDRLPGVAEEQLRTLTPELMDNSVAAQQPLLKEVVEEITRQSLPGMIGPMVEQLVKETIHTEVQKLLSTTGLEIVEKIAWEIVPSQAEIEVKKEIERLTADA